MGMTTGGSDAAAGGECQSATENRNLIYQPANARATPETASRKLRIGFRVWCESLEEQRPTLRQARPSAQRPEADGRSQIAVSLTASMPKSEDVSRRNRAKFIPINGRGYEMHFDASHSPSTDRFTEQTYFAGSEIGRRGATAAAPRRTCRFHRITTTPMTSVQRRKSEPFVLSSVPLRSPAVIKVGSRIVTAVFEKAARRERVAA